MIEGPIESYHTLTVAKMETIHKKSSVYACDACGILSVQETRHTRKNKQASLSRIHVHLVDLPAISRCTDPDPSDSQFHVPHIREPAADTEGNRGTIEGAIEKAIQEGSRGGVGRRAI